MNFYYQIFSNYNELITNIKVNNFILNKDFFTKFFYFIFYLFSTSCLQIILLSIIFKFILVSESTISYMYNFNYCLFKGSTI